MRIIIGPLTARGTLLAQSGKMGFLNRMSQRAAISRHRGFSLPAFCMRNNDLHCRFTRSACCVSILTMLFAFSPPTYGDDEQMEMWGCAHPGQRRTVLHLADWGSRSYVKIQGQRVPAKCTLEGTDRRWDWRGGFLILSEDGIANYFQGGDTTNPVGTFKCRSMN